MTPRVTNGDDEWLRSIQRMVAGAIAEGVGEDQVYDAVCTAIQEAQMNGDRQ